MALITDKLAFFHAPKTGGTWIRAALAACGVESQELVDTHCYPRDIPAEIRRTHFCFTFVRHPAYWYQSRWAFRVQSGWEPRHPLDWHCATNNFVDFVHNSIDYMPSGWCTWLFGQYANDSDFVGTMENLTEDLLFVLKSTGHNVPEPVIRNLAVVNSSRTDGKPPIARYTPELLEQVLITESSIINRYYPRFQLDPNILY